DAPGRVGRSRAATRINAKAFAGESHRRRRGGGGTRRRRWSRGSRKSRGYVPPYAAATNPVGWDVVAPQLESTRKHSPASATGVGGVVVGLADEDGRADHGNRAATSHPTRLRRTR